MIYSMWFGQIVFVLMLQVDLSMLGSRFGLGGKEEEVG